MQEDEQAKGWISGDKRSNLPSPKFQIVPTRHPVVPRWDVGGLVRETASCARHQCRLLL